VFECFFIYFFNGVWLLIFYIPLYLLEI
jgi:hypothetical protein